MAKSRFFRNKGYLDHWVIISSILGIIGSIFMFFYVAIVFQTAILKPYLLFVTIFLLSVSGIRYWRKETWD